MSGKVAVDRTVCDLHKQCIGVAPDLFWAGADGTLQFEETIDDDEVEAAVDAQFLCPTQAISVVRAESG